MSEKILDVIIPAYNAGNSVCDTIAAVRAQSLPSGWNLCIWIVDDGSEDGSGDRVKSRFASTANVHVIKHRKNRGRAAACNTGARAGVGEYLYFTDADCTFVSDYVLYAHLEILIRGADVSVGNIDVLGEGFWAQYQRLVACERLARFQAGECSAFTSANLAMHRDAFLAIGGFDEKFTRYGFEDRDLFLRLHSAGKKIFFCPSAEVVHGADLSMQQVCCKMERAGHYSSGIFMSAHPEMYKKMHFAQADVRLQGTFLRYLAPLFAVGLPLLVWISGKVIDSRWLPFSYKRLFVKAVSGAAYLVGTWRAIG